VVRTHRTKTLYLHNMFSFVTLNSLWSGIKNNVGKWISVKEGIVPNFFQFSHRFWAESVWVNANLLKKLMVYEQFQGLRNQKYLWQNFELTFKVCNSQNLKNRHLQSLLLEFHFIRFSTSWCISNVWLTCIHEVLHLNTREHLKLCHNCFLPYIAFSHSLIIDHLVIWRYIVWATESVVK
jgi:hypothetical protein